MANALTEKAIRAIDKMFAYTAVPQSQTRDNLREIIEHCEIMIEALDDDLECEED